MVIHEIFCWIKASLIFGFLFYLFTCYNPIRGVNHVLHNFIHIYICTIKGKNS